MATGRELAMGLMKYQAAIAEKKAEISAINNKVKGYEEKVAKIEAALLASLQKTKKPVIVGKDQFFLSKTPGKIIIPDIKKVPGWAKKTKTETVADLALIKKKIAAKELDTDVDWFKFEQTDTIKHSIKKEDETEEDFEG